ncbi:hypothetical protein O1611_g1287 [Lasiodiplodia mahajangana]|uniref:Uncharacterized protein n=1 Tax=Lasiodiplodia mahajangana TaxID=1108764 RepID=A0ACC2JXU5_9PEZI|nr:hypothetical protein O1611_g1287 [Lasiodiplodia mahajangana]
MAMDMDAADTLWPGKSNLLTQTLLDELREDVTILEHHYDTFMGLQDLQNGYDLNYLAVHIATPAFGALRLLGSEAPPIVPMDSALAYKAFPASKIYPLPNPEWDAPFQEYGRILEDCINTFILGDSLRSRTDSDDVHVFAEAFSLLRSLISWLSRYPHLKQFTAKLGENLESSRSSTYYAQRWVSQAPEPSYGEITMKRRREAPNSDQPSKKGRFC